MSKFEIVFSTDNAAFGDEPEFEIVRILRKIADDLDRGQLLYTGQPVRIRDINGSRVGFYALQED